MFDVHRLVYFQKRKQISVTLQYVCWMYKTLVPRTTIQNNAMEYSKIQFFGETRNPVIF